MKPVKNISSSVVCIHCCPELFKKYPIVYWNGEWEEDTRHVVEIQPNNSKILRRIEPPTMCHKAPDGQAKWQFLLEDR